MEFLGIGPTELIVILIIVFLVMGPQDLVKLGGKIGRTIRDIRRSEIWRAMQDAGKQMRELPDTLAREAGVEELKEMQKGLKTDLEEQTAAATKDINQQVTAWTRNPEPLSQKAKPKSETPTDNNGSEGKTE